MNCCPLRIPGSSLRHRSRPVNALLSICSNLSLFFAASGLFPVYARLLQFTAIWSCVDQANPLLSSFVSSTTSDSS